MSSVTSKRNKKVYQELTILIIIVCILFFSAVNILIFSKPKKVLGVSTKKVISEEEFWNDFLSKNPDYIPGWLEIGRPDQAKLIDPNYFSQYWP